MESAATNQETSRRHENSDQDNTTGSPGRHSRLPRSEVLAQRPQLSLIVSSDFVEIGGEKGDAIV